MKKWQRGEIATAITIGTLIILGVSSLVSSVFLNKNKQTTKTRAAEACSEEGAWKTSCLEPRERQSCADNAGVALVSRCEGGEWKAQNPECQTQCSPGAQSKGDEWKECNPGEILDQCVRKDCDGSRNELVCIEKYCDSSGNIREKSGSPTGQKCEEREDFKSGQQRGCAVGSIVNYCVKEECDTAIGKMVCYESYYDETCELKTRIGSETNKLCGRTGGLQRPPPPPTPTATLYPERPSPPTARGQTGGGSGNQPLPVDDTFIPPTLTPTPINFIDDTFIPPTLTPVPGALVRRYTEKCQGYVSGWFFGGSFKDGIKYVQEEYSASNNTLLSRKCKVQGTDSLEGTNYSSRGCADSPTSRTCWITSSIPSNTTTPGNTTSNQTKTKSPAGQVCLGNDDCESNLCLNGQCTDPIRIPQPTATPVPYIPVAQAEGAFCLEDNQCVSGLCLNNFCTAPAPLIYQSPIINVHVTVRAVACESDAYPVGAYLEDIQGKQIGEVMKVSGGIGSKFTSSTSFLYIEPVTLKAWGNFKPKIQSQLPGQQELQRSRAYIPSTKYISITDPTIKDYSLEVELDCRKQ